MVGASVVGVKNRERKVIFAHGINVGGGLVLLEALWGWIENHDVVVVLDDRLRQRVPVQAVSKCVFFNQGLWGRLKSEFYVKKIVHAEGLVVSFNSIPPFFMPCSRYVVFFQNVTLLGPRAASTSAHLVSFKAKLKGFLFKKLAHPNIEFIVQTPSVLNCVVSFLGPRLGRTPLVLPFLPNNDVNFSAKKTEQKSKEKPHKKRFIYVADGAPHKNHLTLVRAWALLDAMMTGAECELALTLGNKDLYLWRKIEQESNKHNLSIVNLGLLTRAQINQEYTECSALIFPSKQESFGLPLVEATQLGTDIIASEKDFVRDVCNPIQTFDPSSPLSIARAVQRYLLKAPPPVPCFINGEDFLNRVFKGSNDGF